PAVAQLGLEAIVDVVDLTRGEAVAVVAGQAGFAADVAQLPRRVAAEDGLGAVLAAVVAGLGGPATAQRHGEAKGKADVVLIVVRAVVEADAADEIGPAETATDAEIQLAAVR